MSLSENIAKIRNSVYGKDVREAIAASIEGMDANSKEYARQAAASATAAATSASEATAAANRLTFTINERGNVVVNI